jgi:hypothetical protein
VEEPGQPSTATVYAYVKRNPGFAVRWDEAMRAYGKGVVRPHEVGAS